MKLRSCFTSFRCWAALAFMAGGVSCASWRRTDSAPPPPPDAHRPVLKSETELAAERAEAIRSGVLVPTTGPVFVEAERRATAAAAAKRAPEPLVATPGAIQPDVLMINDDALTVDEVLYPLRDKIAEARRTQTRGGVRDLLTRTIRRQTQEEIGRVLVYREATAKLNEEQKKQIEAAVKRECDERTAREFGGSSARFESHLERYGLTLDQYKKRVERQMIVQQYTWETLHPKVFVRREDLLLFYVQNKDKFSTPETRELLMIEIPYDKCLPDGVRWDRASTALQAQARLKATRLIREAQAAIATRPFEDVAREYSRGIHASDGGAWGEIGKPLQAPYEKVSAQIFQFGAEQVSEPIETPGGWFIVKCGAIKPAKEESFVEAQEKIRRDLSDQRFNELASEYMFKLADKATYSSLDAFIKEAVRRAGDESWPRP